MPIISPLLALLLTTATEPLALVGPPLPAPYVASSTFRNARVMVIVAQMNTAQTGLNTETTNLLVVRDIRSGHTLWKRYVGGKLTVNPLKAQQKEIYAWVRVPGGHWEYVFNLTDGQVLNQIEVRHVAPANP